MFKKKEKYGCLSVSLEHNELRCNWQFLQIMHDKWIKKKEREREKSENKVEMKNIDCKKKEIGLKDEISWAMH